MDEAIIDRLVAGDMRAAARLISALEDGDPEVVNGLRALHRRTGRAHILGITGPPGSGKSTLTDKLIRIFREAGDRVGVLAVDPSSPFTGGAILGDRLRMNEHATDPGVFIRSLASRGRLGGLSRATAAAARVLDAAGYDWVIIETVGVGQSEVDIVRIADTVVLVSVPGLGDDIQVIKAGIMEIGDIFAVNKADREGADRVVREIRGMLETAAALAWSRSHGAGALGRIGGSGHHGSVGGPGATGATAMAADADGHPILPPIIKTVAETGEGVRELAEAIVAHRSTLLASGELQARRLEAARAEIRGLIGYRLIDALEGPEGKELEARLSRAVVSKECDAYEAADLLFASLRKGGTT